MRRPRLGSVCSLVSIVALAVAGTAYLILGVARVDWFTEPTRAAMLLPDAAGLVPRSPVLLTGIRVGAVTSVTNGADGVLVRIRIDEPYRLPADSTVVVESLSALGEPYIEFRPVRGGGPMIQDGQVIRAESVTVPKTIPELARTATTVLRQLDPAAISSLIDTFATALSGTDAVIPQLAHASDLLAATLLSRLPQLRELLDNAQVPGPDVTAAGAAMAAAGPRWGEFGVKVKSVVDSLESLLYARQVPQAYTTGEGLIPFLGHVAGYLDRAGPDAKALFPAVAPLLEQSGDVLQFDLSALITQALNAVTPDGDVRVQITPR